MGWYFVLEHHWYYAGESVMADFDAYLDSIKAQISRIPGDAALAVAQEAFMKLVEHTRIDSGQAALNWHFQPYSEDFSLLDQQMLWGYGSISPVSPAGYKWSKTDNSQAIFMYQFEYMMNQLTFAPKNIRGVVIYNPITPGYPDFAPGSDEFYAHVAFERLDINAIMQEAVATVEASYNG